MIEIQQQNRILLMLIRKFFHTFSTHYKKLSSRTILHALMSENYLKEKQPYTYLTTILKQNLSIHSPLPLSDLKAAIAQIRENNQPNQNDPFQKYVIQVAQGQSFPILHQNKDIISALNAHNSSEEFLADILFFTPEDYQYLWLNHLKLNDFKKIINFFDQCFQFLPLQGSSFRYVILLASLAKGRAYQNLHKKILDHVNQMSDIRGISDVLFQCYQFGIAGMWQRMKKMYWEGKVSFFGLIQAVGKSKQIPPRASKILISLLNQNKEIWKCENSEEEIEQKDLQIVDSILYILSKCPYQPELTPTTRKSIGRLSLSLLHELTEQLQKQESNEYIEKKYRQLLPKIAHFFHTYLSQSIYLSEWQKIHTYHNEALNLWIVNGFYFPNQTYDDQIIGCILKSVWQCAKILRWKQTVHVFGEDIKIFDILKKFLEVNRLPLMKTEKYNDANAASVKIDSSTLQSLKYTIPIINTQKISKTPEKELHKFEQIIKNLEKDPKKSTQNKEILTMCEQFMKNPIDRRIYLIICSWKITQSIMNQEEISQFKKYVLAHFKSLNIIEIGKILEVVNYLPDLFPKSLKPYFLRQLLLLSTTSPLTTFQIRIIINNHEIGKIPSNILDIILKALLTPNFVTKDSIDLLVKVVIKLYDNNLAKKKIMRDSLKLICRKLEKQWEADSVYWKYIDILFQRIDSKNLYSNEFVQIMCYTIYKAYKELLSTTIAVNTRRIMEATEYLNVQKQNPITQGLIKDTVITKRQIQNPYHALTVYSNLISRTKKLLKITQCKEMAVLFGKGTSIFSHDTVSQIISKLLELYPRELLEANHLGVYLTEILLSKKKLNIPQYLVILSHSEEEAKKRIIADLSGIPTNSQLKLLFIDGLIKKIPPQISEIIQLIVLKHYSYETLKESTDDNYLSQKFKQELKVKAASSPQTQ